MFSVFTCVLLINEPLCMQRVGPCCQFFCFVPLSLFPCLRVTLAIVLILFFIPRVNPLRFLV